MNDLNKEVIEEIFDTPPEEIEQEESAELSEETETEEVEEVKLSPLELEAQGMGHTSKEEWAAAGKDPDRWKTAHEYVSFGHIKQQMDKNQAEFDQRIEGLNKLHKADLDARIEALEAEKRQAVEEGMVDDYDLAQKKIDNLNKPVEKVESGKDPEIAAWEAQNPWIDDLTQVVDVNGVDIPKANIANTLFSKFKGANPNASNRQVLDYIDREMIKVNGPPPNPRRSQVTTHERSTPSPKGPKKLSWSDLTQDEVNSWNQFGRDMFENKAEFLQSVKDSRG